MKELVKDKRLRRLMAWMLSALLMINIINTGIASQTGRTASTDEQELLYESVFKMYCEDTHIDADGNKIEPEMWEKGNAGDFSVEFNEPLYADDFSSADISVRIIPKDNSVTITGVRLVGSFGDETIASPSEAQKASESDSGIVSTYEFTVTKNAPSFIIYYTISDTEDNSGYETVNNNSYSTEQENTIVIDTKETEKNISIENSKRTSDTEVLIIGEDQDALDAEDTHLDDSVALKLFDMLFPAINVYAGDNAQRTEYVWVIMDSAITDIKPSPDDEITIDTLIPSNGTNVVENRLPDDGSKVTVYNSSDTDESQVVNKGDRITYSLTAKNSGSAMAKYTMIRDYIPDGTRYVQNSADNGGVYVDASTSANGRPYVEWKLTDIYVGNIKTVHFATEIITSKSMIITNIGQYETMQTDMGIPGDPSNPELWTLTNATENTTDAKNPVPAKIQIELDSDDDHSAGSSVEAGDVIKYIFRVKNSGGSAAKDIYIKDYIPAGTNYIPDSADNNGMYMEDHVSWLVDSMEAGDSINMSFKVSVESPITVNMIENQAYFYDSYDYRDNISPDNTTNVIEHTIPRKPVKTVISDTGKDGEAVVSGSLVQYKITYYNHISDAQDITITDPLSDKVDIVSASDNGVMSGDTVIWNIKDVPAYESGSVTLTVRIAPTDDVGSLIENTAHVQVGNSEWEDSNTTKNPIASSGENSGDDSSGGGSGSGSVTNPDTPPSTPIGIPDTTTDDDSSIPIADMPVPTSGTIDANGMPLDGLPKTGEKNNAAKLMAFFGSMALAALAGLGIVRKKENQ